MLVAVPDDTRLQENKPLKRLVHECIVHNPSVVGITAGPFLSKELIMVSRNVSLIVPAKNIAQKEKINVVLVSPRRPI